MARHGGSPVAVAHLPTGSESKVAAAERVDS
jgi:hypothetical protein